MKIGIVGSGIAGLATAWFFQRAGHRVSLFEKQEQLGMDAQSITIHDDQHSARIDVPSRMFNRLLWPNVVSLYEILGVEMDEVQPSQSFSQLGEPSYLNVGVAYRPALDVRSLLSSKVRQILREAKRLKEIGAGQIATGIDPQLTLAEYLQSQNFGDSFIHGFLYPTLSSTVCTCSYQALDKYPARFILEALDHLTESPLSRTRHGTQDVIERITSAGFEIHTSHEVLDVIRTNDTVGVKTLCDSHSKSWQFDHFVFATQANHVDRIFGGISPAEQDVLERFAYESVPVVIHNDNSLMPVDQKSWSTFNMISDTGGAAAMCTVLMNQFNRLWPLRQSVFQTINPIRHPESTKVISESQLQRPVVTFHSFAAWEKLDKLHSEPNRNIWFAGSFAQPGIPLLESALNSALKIAEQLKILVPSAFRPTNQIADITLDSKP